MAIANGHVSKLNSQLELVREDGGELFGAEGLGGFDSGGTASRNVAREQGDSSKEQADRDEGEGIGFAHTEKLRFEQPRESERESGTDNESCKRQLEPLTKNEAVDVSLLSAKSHADADFARALARGVGDHTVDADGSEQHRQKPEGASEGGGDAIEDSSEAHGERERVHVEYGQLRVELVDGLLNGKSQSAWITVGSQVDSGVLRRAVGLIDGQINGGLRRVGE